MNEEKYHYGTTDKDIEKLRVEMETNENGPEPFKSMMEQRQTLQKLYNYWKFDRKEELKHRDELLMRWAETKKKKELKSKQEQYWEEKQAADEAFFKKEEEMLIELVKIRHSLWT